MKTTLLFLLASLFTTTISGMNLPNPGELIFERHDILPHLTEQIGIIHRWQIFLVKKDLHALALTNTCLYDYYTDELVQQGIITRKTQNGDYSDEEIAQHLKYKFITKKMEHYRFIASDSNKKFTTKELQETWYLNTTHSPFRTPLIIHAINNKNISTIKEMIKAKININTCNGYPLQCTLDWRINPRYGEEKNSKIYLAIAEILLKNGAQPNLCSCPTSRPLLTAVCYNDKDFTRLLLMHGARPVKVCSFNKDLQNYDENSVISTANDSKEWYITMYDEIQQKK